MANSEGLENVFSESGWCNNPVAVADSKLCEVEEHFLECVAGIRENSEISTRTDCFPLEDGSSRKYQDLHCITTDLNTDSAACSLTLRDLMSFTAPKNLIVVKQDAIVSNGCWWTDGHIEVGGGDGISYTPLGSKLFLICRRGHFSAKFERLMRDPWYFMHYIETGPQKNNIPHVWFYIPSKNHFLCQPACCSHAVLTSDSPAIVTGWEALDLDDSARINTILSCYGQGLKRGTWKSLITKFGLEKMLTELRTLKKSNTNVFEHLEYLNSLQIDVGTAADEASSSAGISKRGRPSGPSKKAKRAFNLPGRGKLFKETESVMKLLCDVEQ